jgi:hypothetical protein
MSLTAITTSKLYGEASNRGRALTVADAMGNVVVEAMESKVDSARGVLFDTAEGRWRMEQARPTRTRLGAILTAVASRSEVAILDDDGNTVATARNGQVVLPSGEILIWDQTSIPRTRYQLGGDLWVASGTWRSGRRFNAELSTALLSRKDKALLVGIASILTQHAITRQSRLSGAAANLGAAWG